MKNNSLNNKIKRINFHETQSFYDCDRTKEDGQEWEGREITRKDDDISGTAVDSYFKEIQNPFWHFTS